MNLMSLMGACALSLLSGLSPKMTSYTPNYDTYGVIDTLNTTGNNSGKLSVVLNDNTSSPYACAGEGDDYFYPIDESGYIYCANYITKVNTTYFLYGLHPSDDDYYSGSLSGCLSDCLNDLCTYNFVFALVEIVHFDNLDSSSTRGVIDYTRFYVGGNKYNLANGMLSVDEDVKLKIYQPSLNYNLGHYYYSGMSRTASALHVDYSNTEYITPLHELSYSYGGNQVTTYSWYDSLHYNHYLFPCYTNVAINKDTTKDTYYRNHGRVVFTYDTNKFDLNDGYSVGFDAGYNQGYTAGIANSEYQFTDLFGAIADTPVLIVRNLFDFDLFGMNMLTVVLSLFTALILFYIIRKLL